MSVECDLCGCKLDEYFGRLNMMGSCRMTCHECFNANYNKAFAFQILGEQP